ncbi:hypothetical protein [Neptuniibacter sp. QD37_11]|uniref:hypothetical protein n=1 Tax=Neptuniibacter sp. QD37_11 TaxID=3398209 RepID=UPI0039F5BFB1
MLVLWIRWITSATVPTGNGSKDGIDLSEIKEFMDNWNLQPVEAAKVLKIQKSKLSEYASGARVTPPYILAHIETFNRLSEAQGKKLIHKRLA